MTSALDTAIDTARISAGGVRLAYDDRVIAEHLDVGVRIPAY